ncbi:hypothetical protein DUNSADRAFT_12588 [Dunaliella salina]|uniref:Uncharacterized protein n=1 Tax=Dunaliella salina TaxID=3046 RepID=A0ABQ7GB01_DUNSA|nr:hypothetical protein DUNSADRAFT_12588 [Dunaliella salina]|eukprot:KAF5831778.1 hypothetical protein DUNSADRAFT_12588 [Dunaliella salina]
MGLLAAGSKRVGSVVAQGKDAVSQAKGAAQEDKQPSIGKEKSQGFYYDKARNRWVIEGEEPAEPPPPPPPPPTILGPQTGMRSRYVDPLFSGSAQPPEQAAPPSCLLPVPPQGNTPAAPLSTFYVPSAPTNFKEGITEGSSSGGDHSNEISACRHVNQIASDEHLPFNAGTAAFGSLEAAFKLSGQNDGQEFKDVAF